MNIIQLQDALKDFSEEQLIREMQQPSGNAPQYLVLSEIERRQKVKQGMQSQQGSEPSVAEEAVSRRMPAQNSAIAQSMVQPSPATQPPQMKAGGITALKMRDGGVVKASNGFFADVTNNPGNIRPGGGFLGESGSERGFATFSDPMYGMRALARLPVTYANEYGINTVEGLVSRYAPRSENKESFDNYVNFLSRQLGVRPDQEVDFTDPQVRQAMLPAIMDFEQGAGYSDRYDPSTFSAAVAAADLEDPEDVMTAFSSARSPDETVTPPFVPGISAAQASTPTPSALTLPGADKENATPEERWEFLSRRPPGGLDVEERAELFDLTKQFGTYQPPSKTEGLGSPVLNEFLQEYVLDPVQTYIGDPISEFMQENIVAPAQSAIEDPERAGAYLVSTPEELEQFDKDRAKRLQEEAIARAEESGDATRRGSPSDEVLPAEDPAVAAEVATEGAAEKRPAPGQAETTGMPTVNELLRDLRDRQLTQIEAAREDEEFNRYLAIAQMGAKLAEGKGPFIGAIGQAIGEGLPTLAAARQGVREAEKEALQTDIDIAQTLADAESRQTFGLEDRLRVANAINDDIINLQKQIDQWAPYGQAVTPEMQARIDEKQAQITALQRDRQLLIGGYGFGATPVTGQTPQTADQARAAFKSAAGLE
jgi:hypothetical protein